MKELSLLVVDDDPLVIQSIKMVIPEQWHVTGLEVPGIDIPNTSFHVAIIDMHLTGNLKKTEGLDLIQELRQKHPHIEIIAMSGNLDRDLMDKCLKAGASRYLAKPLSVDEIVLTLEKIEGWLLLQGATHRGQQSPMTWIGNGEASKNVKRRIADLRGESGPILIEGESGTGKEVVSQLIHEQSEGGPFISINIAAIPENLFESELFGHVRGAFTGADQNKMGLAEAAHEGDLFLDEIEALSLPLQVKLLRFLETGEIRRLGSKDIIKVRTRVICATNENLEKMVKEEKFRKDLLWRLNGKKIFLPTLRERSEDLQALVEHFFKMDKARRKELSPEALVALKQHTWPGNVRELLRVCEQLLLMAPLPVIRREDVFKIIQPTSATIETSEIDFDKGLSQLSQEYEAQVITKSLDQFKDVDEVSRVLKISRSSLYKKIKDHNIEWRSS